MVNHDDSDDIINMTIIVNEGNPGCHNTSTMTSGGGGLYDL